MQETSTIYRTMTIVTFKFSGGKCVGRIQPENHLMVLMQPHKNKSFTDSYWRILQMYRNPKLNTLEQHVGRFRSRGTDQF